MLSLFGKKRISVEDQLKELLAAGIRLSAGISVDDLFLFDNRDKMEKEPYNALISALGFCTEDGEDIPFCTNLWMCDYECIDDHGTYVKLINRLHILSGERPGLTSITDYVDIEEGKAFVEFSLNGTRYHWDVEVDDDWLDPSVFVKYDILLKDHTDMRIYSNHTDFGQAAFLGCFTDSQFVVFRRLSKVLLIPIAEQV